MDYKIIRQTIKAYTSDPQVNIRLLKSLGIDITRDGFFKVRPEERTPSCKVNADGSFHDFGSGEHYSDIISLLYDGYNAFDSLSDTMEWLCRELNISMEANHVQR